MVGKVPVSTVKRQSSTTVYMYKIEYIMAGLRFDHGPLSCCDCCNNMFVLWLKGE